MRQKWSSKGPLFGSVCAQVKGWLPLSFSKPWKSWRLQSISHKWTFLMDPFPLTSLFLSFKHLGEEGTFWNNYLTSFIFYIILCFSNYVRLGHVIERIVWYFWTPWVVISVVYQSKLVMFLFSCTLSIKGRTFFILSVTNGRTCNGFICLIVCWMLDKNL